jgi:hypothetical protein
VRALSLVFGLILATSLPASALAQDEGVADAPTTNPMGVVMAARGAATPVLSVTRRHRRAQPFEETMRVPVERGRCYEVLAYATGTSPVFAQVLAGHARVGDSLAMTNSIGRVARQRFCATQPAELYSLELRAEGESWWYLAVVPAGGAADAGVGIRTTTTTVIAAGDTTTPARRYPIGGGDDYVARQIQAFARQRPGIEGITETARVTLPTNGAYEGTVAIPSGRCVHVVAAGVPSVADLVVELEDPAGHRVAQDATRRNVESVRHCASYAGTFRLRVRVFSGAGLVGVQALLEP